MTKLKYKIIIISILDNFEKESLSILIQKTKVLILDIKKIDIAIIGANAYRTNYKLKRAQIFAIFIKNLEYQAKKKARPKTNLKIVIPKKYCDLFNICNRKNSNIHVYSKNMIKKIILKEKKKHSYTLL